MSICLFQGVSGPPPATAPVAARSTWGRSFHITQVWIRFYLLSLDFFKPKRMKCPRTKSSFCLTSILVLRRTSQARFWPLVDFIFLSETSCARHAERIRKSKVSTYKDSLGEVNQAHLPFKLMFPLCCRNGTYTVANGQVTCIAREMVLKRQVSESSESGKSEASQSPPTLS